jgi:hypothetical protein
MFKKITACAPVLAGVCLFLNQCNLRADTFSENFATNPSAHGWKAYGNTNLFAWSSANQNLQVTWDSAQTNSYFYRPLGTILAKEDDFSLEFDLRLSDIVTNARSGPFEIAVGFFKLAETTDPNFWRGSGVDAVHGPRDLVEFDYFTSGYYPGFGGVDPTISPTVLSSNNAFAAGFTLLELTTNDLFHISISYTGSLQTLHTVLTRNGAAFGPVDDVVLDPNFSDFRLDSVSISSYSDVGDDYDSVLAHGVIDNLSVVTPPPPATNFRGGFTNGNWQVQFLSRTNWFYTVERTVNFQSWTGVGARLSGTGTTLTSTDTSAPPGRAYYRVRAERP